MYLLSFDPAVPQSWYIPKRNNNRCPHKNWQMHVFSSIIHKGQSWKQLKYLSTDEQISKMWYIHAIEYYLEKAMAPHSSAFAWKIPWMEEPGKLQSMGLLRVRHDWATSLSLFTFMHWRRKCQPTPEFLPGESQGWGSLVGCRLCGCTESDMTKVT